MRTGREIVDDLGVVVIDASFAVNGKIVQYGHRAWELEWEFGNTYGVTFRNRRIAVRVLRKVNKLRKKVTKKHIPSALEKNNVWRV